MGHTRTPGLFLAAQCSDQPAYKTLQPPVTVSEGLLTSSQKSANIIMSSDFKCLQGPWVPVLAVGRPGNLLVRSQGTFWTLGWIDLHAWSLLLEDSKSPEQAWVGLTYLHSTLDTHSSDLSALGGLLIPGLTVSCPSEKGADLQVRNWRWRWT